MVYINPEGTSIVDALGGNADLLIHIITFLDESKMYFFMAVLWLYSAKFQKMVWTGGEMLRLRNMDGPYYAAKALIRCGSDDAVRMMMFHRSHLSVTLIVEPFHYLTAEAACKIADLLMRTEETRVEQMLKYLCENVRTPVVVRFVKRQLGFPSRLTNRIEIKRRLVWNLLVTHNWSMSDVDTIRGHMPYGQPSSDRRKETLLHFILGKIRTAPRAAQLKAVWREVVEVMKRERADFDTKNANGKTVRDMIGTNPYANSAGYGHFLDNNPQSSSSRLWTGPVSL